MNRIRRMSKRVVVAVIAVVCMVVCIFSKINNVSAHGSHAYYTASSSNTISHDGGFYVHINGPYGFACYFVSVSFAQSKTPTYSQLLNQTTGYLMNLSISHREGTTGYNLSLAESSIRLKTDVENHYYILNPTFNYNSFEHYNIKSSASAGATTAINVHARFNFKEYSYDNANESLAISKPHLATSGSFAMQINIIQCGLKNYLVNEGSLTGKWVKGHDSTATITQNAEGQYSVSYDANGGTSTPSTTYQWTCSATTLASAISKNNDNYQTITTTLEYGYDNIKKTLTSSSYMSYSFASWSGYSANTSQYWGGNSITLVAAWNTSRQYTSISLPTPTKTGYVFDGWYTSSNGRNKVSTSYTPTTNTTLYAHFKPITYQIIYNSNNGTSGTTSASTHVYDTSKALTKNGYIREPEVIYHSNTSDESVKINNIQTSIYKTNAKWQFVGWSTSKNSSSVAYNDEQTVLNLTTTNNAKINLYALWQGGDTTLVDASRDHYTFMGWSTNKSSASGDEGFTNSWTNQPDTKKIINIPSSTNLYAVWDEHPTLKTPNTITLFKNDHNITLGDLINSHKSLFSALDKEDGDLTSLITIDSITYPDGTIEKNLTYNDIINTSIAGNCIVSYKVKDHLNGTTYALNKTINISDKRISDEDKNTIAPRFINISYTNLGKINTLLNSKKWHTTTTLNTLLLDSLNKEEPIASVKYSTYQ